jgi:hypothetical protein
VPSKIDNFYSDIENEHPSDWNPSRWPKVFARVYNSDVEARTAGYSSDDFDGDDDRYYDFLDEESIEAASNVRYRYEEGEFDYELAKEGLLETEPPIPEVVPEPRKKKKASKKASGWKGKFRKPGTKTLQSPDALGEVLFRCIQYMESMGSLATMVGEEEESSCINTLLDAVTTDFRSSHDEKMRNVYRRSITVFPDSYEGNNPDILNEIQNPNYELITYSIPRSNVETLLRQGMSYPEIYEQYGRRMSFYEAVVKFFLYNDKVSPEQPHCSEGTVKFNCLSQILDLRALNIVSRTYNSNVLHPFMTMNQEYMFKKENDPLLDKRVINILNSGAKCRVRATTLSRKQSWVSSCLEAAMKSTENLIRLSTSDGPLIRNASDYDWNQPCMTGFDNKVDTDITRTEPCIASLLRGGNAGMYGDTYSYAYLSNALSHEVGSGGSREAEVLSLLQKEYDFLYFDDKHDRRKTTGFDFIFDSGFFLDNLYSQSSAFADILGDLKLCKYPGVDGYESCMNKVLMKIRDNTYSMRISGNDRITEAMVRGVLNADCSFYDAPGRKVPSTCMDYLMAATASNKSSSYGSLDYVLRNLMRKTPLSDLTCTSTDGERVESCMDGLMRSSANPNVINMIDEIGLLLDRPDCTDGYGNHITCIDKTIQLNEVSTYLLARSKELDKMRQQVSSTEDRTRIGEKMQKLQKKAYEMVGAHSGDYTNPGLINIIYNYDIGNEKCHAPSREFADLKAEIDEEISDLEVWGNKIFGDNDNDVSKRLRYLKELKESITAEAAPRPTQVAPRLFKLYDATRDRMKYSTDSGRLQSSYATWRNMLKRTGLTYMAQGNRSGGMTLNMFECKDDDNRTISCMQKLLDSVKNEADYRSVRGISGDRDEENALRSVFSLPGIFSPGMCSVDGKKVSCFEYAWPTYSRYVSPSTYIDILAGKDFKKNKSTHVSVKNPLTGATEDLTLQEAVCRNVSLYDLAEHMYNTRTQHSVTNGRPRFDAQALELYSPCVGCDDIKDPLGKRMCLDQALFDAYIKPGNSSKTGNNALNSNDKQYWEWTNMFVDKPDRLYNPFPYQKDTDDVFGIAGVYDIDYDPRGYMNVSSSENQNDMGKYSDAVENSLWPALKRARGMKFPRFGDYKDVVVEDIDLLPRKSGSDDYQIKLAFRGNEKDGRRVAWTQTIPVVDLFTKGGMLNRDDARMYISKYRNVDNAVNLIMTRKNSTGKSDTGTSRIKLIISNRPSDFLRASLGQKWTSCMGFKAYKSCGMNHSLLTYMNLGSYIAFLASDEFSTGWLSRTYVVPAMEKPDDTWGSKSKSNTFLVLKPYGLPDYSNILKEAVARVLYENGYNKPGAFYEELYAGRDVQRFVYHEGDSDRGRMYRIDKNRPTCSLRYLNYINGLKSGVLERCVAHAAEGTPIMFKFYRYGEFEPIYKDMNKDSDWHDRGGNSYVVGDITSGRGCEANVKDIFGIYIPKLTETIDVGTYLAEAGLISDYDADNLKYSRDWTAYHEPPDEGLYEIGKEKFDSITKRIRVATKTRPLTLLKNAPSAGGE